MHIGSILLFEGPRRARTSRQHLDSRLHPVPRYRHKLSFPRLEMGRPLWVDDPSFNIGYHVRHTALPAPGSVEQLCCSRRGSSPAPRSLEAALGAVAGRGLTRRVRAGEQDPPRLVDGVSGADLTAVMFDLDRDGTEVPAPSRLEPAPEPCDVRSWRRAARPRRRTRGARPRALGAVQPAPHVDRAREAASGVGEFAWGTPNSPPEDPAERDDRATPPGDLDPRLAELKAIKNGLAGP